MCAAFSDDDVGKTVVNASGEEVGMVTAVEHGTARVKPDPGITDSIKATLGWEGTSEDTYPLQEDAIDHVTSNEIRLSGDVHEGSTSGTLDSKRTGDADSTAGTDAGQPTGGESSFQQDETEMDTSGRGDDSSSFGQDETDMETSSRGDESSSLGQDETDMEGSNRGRSDETSSLDDTGHTGSREPASEPTTGTDLGDETGSSGRSESSVPDRDVEGRGEEIGDSGGDDRPMDEPRGDESGLIDADRDDRTDRTHRSSEGDADDEAMDPDVGDGDRVSDDVTSEDRDRQSRDEDSDDDSSTI